MAKVFLTGATGFVGGDFLHRFASSAASKYAISALVRNADKAQQISSQYPSVKVVQGDLDDSQLVEKEARNADIVLHLASTKHIASSKAIQRGLTDPARSKPGYWIQISGATLLAIDEIKNARFGFESDKVYDDIRDIKEILSTIKNNPSRDVDNLVAGQDSSKVKTALIVGPHIYGKGRGPGNQRSVQAPEIARVTLQLKEGFRLNEGKNSWSYIHVHDLSDLFASLVDAAAETKPGLWNDEGIYTPENGSLTFGELSEKIAAEAKKQDLIPEGSVKKVLDAQGVDALSGHASILWGTNAVLGSSRARSLLHWKPSRPSLEETLPEIVRIEGQKQSNRL
ncbi:NAD(P)-binding protein [Aaosphaeria arxii CBS 175.79]|uniref:NAD(P)-binding protein n=1 Tax=Aaosphaeria arxii CBS 175.79 TaxID=1450172 RepID=A0A6A5X9K0_9PLEO|nr:NAD(P)-binding protein [Aaosphaeria arxii CBS 175.79]KAF2009725.1 NAD(P)-binding protein [Aaosphaeria arxii CBS 175.79]